MKYIGENKEHFELLTISLDNCASSVKFDENDLSLIWFQSDNCTMTIDTVPYEFANNDIISLTEFHKIDTVSIDKAQILKFNRSFYCILDHDSEVGCKGILYFGAAMLPVIKPNEVDLEILKTVWKMIGIEMKSYDNLQLEMLQMMLKRMLILVTRVFKSQENFGNYDVKSNDIVRDFNFLVEQNFKSIHSVAGYADLLFKSPKTLSNVFKKIGDKTPLQYIHARIMLEARRLLKYSDMSISQIAYEIGYDDTPSFSRFFKKNEGISPVDYRKS